MTEPYLILHKVRGQPAFDIATRLEFEGAAGPGTDAIWIIPTSGHRAYPMYHVLLSQLDIIYEGGMIGLLKDAMSQYRPDQFPDHYRASEPPPLRATRPSARPAPTTDDFLV